MMELPLNHFETLQKSNGNLFRFLAHDLETLKRTNKRVEEILPPLGECAEDAYIQAFAEFAAKNRHLYPQIRDQASVNAVLNSLLREYRAVLSFVHGGSKRFYFAEGLTEVLCCTVLNMACDHLQLPYSGFMMVYDSPAAVEAVSALMKQPFEEGSVVTAYVREDNLPQIGFRRLLLTAFVMKGEGAPAVVSRQLALRSDWNLEQALHTDWDKLGKADPSPGASQRLNAQGEYEPLDTPISVFYEEGLQFIRLLVNSILYVTSRDAELAERLCQRPVHAIPTKSAPSEKARDPQGWTLVGESVDPVPIIVDPTRRAEPGAQLHRAGRYRVRFDVCGVWRRHPNTPPDSKKDVWVRPHKRGPEMATLVNSPYVVR